MIEDIKYYLNYELPEIIKYNIDIFLNNIDATVGIFPLIIFLLLMFYIIYITKSLKLQNTILQTQNMFFEDLSRLKDIEDVEKYILSYTNEIDAQYSAFYEKRGESFLLLSKNIKDENNIFVPLKLEYSVRKHDKSIGRYKVCNYISNNQEYLLRFYSLKTLNVNNYVGFIEIILQYYKTLKNSDSTTADQQIQNRSKVISEHIHGNLLGQDNFLKFLLSLIMKAIRVDGLKIFSTTNELILGNISNKESNKKLFYIRNTPYKLEVYNLQELTPSQMKSIGTFLELAGTLLLTLTDDNKVLDTYLEFLQQATINLENENHYYKNHSKKVALVASQVAKKLFLGQDKITNIEIASSIHDIGMVGDLTTLINSKDKLYEDDLDILKYHPIIGEIIVHPIANKYPISTIIQYHHERYDGKGYPYGLVGGDIPIEAQVVAFAETFIGIIGDRKYKKGLSIQDAKDKVQKMSDKAFSSVIIDAFNDVFESLEKRLERLDNEDNNTF